MYIASNNLGYMVEFESLRIWCCSGPVLGTTSAIPNGAWGPPMLHPLIPRQLHVIKEDVIHTQGTTYYTGS